MAWMTQEEAALALGISPQTVRRRVGNGSLRATRRGQVILVDVDWENRSARPDEVPARSPEQIVATAVHQAATRPMASELEPAQVAGHRITLAKASPSELPAETSGGRWLGVIAWLSTTGLLFAVAVTAWLHHQGNLRYRDLEERYQQAHLDHQQAVSAQEARVQALALDGRRRQESMTSDLSDARARIDSLKQELEAQGATIRDLRASLGAARDDHARTIAQRDKLLSELASARTSLAAAKIRRHLGLTIATARREIQAIGSRIMTLALPAAARAETATEPAIESQVIRPPDPAPRRPAVQLRSIVEPTRLPEAEASARPDQSLSGRRLYGTP